MMYKNNVNREQVIIIDWDDTIIPSTFIDRWQIETWRDLPLHFQNMLEEVGRCAEKFLEEASRYAEVIIITNSDDGWVKFSAERFVPYLLPVIEKYRIVSARTGYEKFYPGQPLCWKAAAFAHEVNEFYESMKKYDDDNNASCASMTGTDVSSVSSDDSMDEDRMESEKVVESPLLSGKAMETRRERREIISFGDSLEERTAVRIVAGQLDCTPKSVMFLNSPSPLQLIGQMHMLTNHMKFVCEKRTSLDLEISAEQAQRCADSYMKKKEEKESVYDHKYIPGCIPRIVRTESGSNDAIAPMSA